MPALVNGCLPNSQQSTNACTPSIDPHRRQTLNFREFLAITGDISERVVEVLDLMDSLHLNLPLLLWAISWNVPELVLHSRARFARTALPVMTSEELPGILANWHRPPRAHNQGIRTKAACNAMNEWALDVVCNMLDQDMSALEPTMHYPQEDLKEETLLDISWSKMIPEVNERRRE